MRNGRPPLGVSAVIVIIALALVLPRLRAQSAPVTADSSAQIRQAILDYAQARFWDDFLEGRALHFPRRTLPAPSLAEYRSYLSGLGLHGHGEQITILLFPPLAGRRLDRVQVVRDDGEKEVDLHLALRHPDRLEAVGTLQVAEDPEAALRCGQKPPGKSQLWSLWPFTPIPLLP